MNLNEYLEKYHTSISQESEKLFVTEFLYPLVGSHIEEIEPQYIFVDSTGRSRRIDFACHSGINKIALEVNGETYHAEGIIPNEQFDDNLFRQNQILHRGYKLLRFSYSQLQSPYWRPLVMQSLRELFANYAPHLLSNYSLEPNTIQIEALESLNYARSVREWKKGVIVMPTGTGKTILSALDAKSHGGRVLFIVHRLDILSQSINAYKSVWGILNEGLLTGEERYSETSCDVLFASKDTLRQPHELSRFSPDWFDYIVIDEVHHGQSPSYQSIIKYFKPNFMLGMTATPDRTDRKDIFELFDYNKIYEVDLHEVIERGFLVPYTYIGLTDNIDYSKIRYQNQRYRVDDLEKLLIIPERNQAILNAYLEPDKGNGDKAIGFCVSIIHAERMAEFFIKNGVKAAAIHSATQNRNTLIQQFKNNDLQIIFTVDLFNEGMDFPNIRVLLFLRPTESKTVFLQQLGRGLRLCAGKDRVRILDFIGNYNRANQIRKYLSHNSSVIEDTDKQGKRIRKIVYEYSSGCEVHFDTRVEEILNQQDNSDLGIDKQDLINNYFTIAEDLQRKPTRTDLDSQGGFPIRLYNQAWGSWRAFLQDIGEYTEASYHYPQGTHLGHVFSILWYFGLPSRQGTHFDDAYIRMRGGLGEGRIGTYQRQLKYKLQAAMELGLLIDDRSMSTSETYQLELTSLGYRLRHALEPYLKTISLQFPSDDGIPSTRMMENETFYNNILRNAILNSMEIKQIVGDVFLEMRAVQQMLKFLYHIARKQFIEKEYIYEYFFQSPFVRQFCDQEGIEQTTTEAARRRCPFLLNILEGCNIIQLTRSSITINKLFLMPYLLELNSREDRANSVSRLRAIRTAWPNKIENISESDLVIVRELFGSNFLTNQYHLSELETVGT
jgi:superfamily II DNA or RNA helicase